MNTELETLWKTYDTVNEWIRFSDTKAGAILAANGVIAGIVLANLASAKDFLHKNPVFLIFLITGVIAGCMSIYFSIRCLNPTLRVGEPTSLIFFAHVAQKFEKPSDYEQAVSKAFTDDVQAMAQIAQQVWANSSVAWKKYKAVVWAIRFLELTVLVGIAGILAALI